MPFRTRRIVIDRERLRVTSDCTIINTAVCLTDYHNDYCSIDKLAYRFPPFCRLTKHYIYYIKYIRNNIVFNGKILKFRPHKIQYNIFYIEICAYNISTVKAKLLILRKFQPLGEISLGLSQWFSTGVPREMLLNIDKCFRRCCYGCQVCERAVNQKRLRTTGLSNMKTVRPSYSDLQRKKLASASSGSILSEG
ncbi:hypothetical protein AGLY_007923 [Aphis glycines]|uniref:Uncharacterized protein n=1 Tax=Aphis glycines TaxID=307491 RepID=A0A6G0TLW4_APHGL|nr:hypothetical protein AGLY_007923 [Aphis glycines]